ncbi:bifunctional 4-hydroxy-2-oxoglutarate aldolase/2-dehydro-3-deoxy-phosphogluconate aldolase [Catalinimonas niigatensis]|uniref:bifunctional 4-hydroxy-2-oxoglutarate aldolase/2-dehydro-3-deoxy-phosphogluconate aldolase n=1 Tax=Catalinimonas niigatensis TaxID=1397264 RepID=UPI0026668BD7|nr:bifunctional 4-hydroxy-2-oxoglutarate aldolase/2-dehydro-3-deoxy-phosphogluconate aldolase [Catalinimonas niigatensis]WPP51696.1 bifunctional 4-hydroxy-2-oxoglutarate aldolase/2-dehydro-3-deoxy-phosphogluconate aldolase [Catalinimonas niigatensis]
MSKPFSWEQFNDMPIVGILRKLPAHKLEKIVSLYQQCGLTTLEITMNTEGAAEMIQQLNDAYPNLNVGAGTVCNQKDLDVALRAGASFIVTPITDEKLIARCKESNVPVFPGAFTPSEIYKAWSAGAEVVKLFPAGLLGPKYIKDVLAPLDQIKLMPVGGVDLQNFTEFLQAGAVGLGLGSQLFLKEAIENEAWEQLESHFKAFVDKYRAYRGS